MFEYLTSPFSALLVSLLVPLTFPPPMAGVQFQGFNRNARSAARSHKLARNDLLGGRVHNLFRLLRSAFSCSCMARPAAHCQSLKLAAVVTVAFFLATEILHPVTPPLHSAYRLPR